MRQVYVLFALSLKIVVTLFINYVFHDSAEPFGPPSWTTPLAVMKWEIVFCKFLAFIWTQMFRCIGLTNMRFGMRMKYNYYVAFASYDDLHQMTVSGFFLIQFCWGFYVCQRAKWPHPINNRGFDLFFSLIREVWRILLTLWARRLKLIFYYEFYHTSQILSTKAYCYISIIRNVWMKTWTFERINAPQDRVFRLFGTSVISMQENFIQRLIRRCINEIIDWAE